VCFLEIITSELGLDVKIFIREISGFTVSIVKFATVKVLLKIYIAKE
jgi:hypothetical protein